MMILLVRLDESAQIARALGLPDRRPHLRVLADVSRFSRSKTTLTVTSQRLDRHRVISLGPRRQHVLHGFRHLSEAECTVQRSINRVAIPRKSSRASRNANIYTICPQAHPPGTDSAGCSVSMLGPCHPTPIQRC